MKNIPIKILILISIAIIFAAFMAVFYFGEIEYLCSRGSASGNSRTIKYTGSMTRKQADGYLSRYGLPPLPGNAGNIKGYRWSMFAAGIYLKCNVGTAGGLKYMNAVSGGKAVAFDLSSIQFKGSPAVVDWWDIDKINNGKMYEKIFSDKKGNPEYLLICLDSKRNILYICRTWN